MKVIVDTDVWSEAFRKRGEKSLYLAELKTLIEESRVELLGVVKLEILCGIRDRLVFDRIAKSLSPFPTHAMTSEVFVTAAEFLNTCRSKGIQGSNNDFLICAASALWGLPILTKDQDFKRYQKHLPISLASSPK
jgi:predicted nucleic acid-binding protein